MGKFFKKLISMLIISSLVLTTSQMFTLAEGLNTETIKQVESIEETTIIEASGLVEASEEVGASSASPNDALVKFARTEDTSEEVGARLYQYIEKSTMVVQVFI